MWRHVATTAAFVLVSAATAACGGDPDPGATPSMSGAPTGPPARRPGLVLAVTSASRGLELYDVGPDRVARLRRLLAPPTPTWRVSSVTLSAGPEPTACAAWGPPGRPEEPDALSLVCYFDGAREGSAVPTPKGRLGAVALRPDAGALALTHHTPGTGVTSDYPQTNVHVAYLRDGSVTGGRRLVPDPSRPPSPDLFLGIGAESVAWAGSSALAISLGAESDDGSRLVLMPLSDEAAAGGYLRGSPVRPTPRPDPPTVYARVVSATATEALAIERPHEGGGSDREVAARAVRVDLATGRVLDVVAKPRPGRDVISVSGGDRGVGYVTCDCGLYSAPGEGERWAYLRLPGEPRGTRITGLPADVDLVIAQP